MVDKPYLIEIIISLAENNVEFIICGGLAAVFHGVERMTMDIDISLNMAPQNIKKFLPVVKALGLVPRAPVPPESLLNKEQVEFFIRKKNALVFSFLDPDLPFRQIDVFLREDKRYDLLKKHSIETHIDYHKVRIISKEKLLEMKLGIDPPRDKDRHDIDALRKIIEQGRGYDETQA